MNAGQKGTLETSKNVLSRTQIWTGWWRKQICWGRQKKWNTFQEHFFRINRYEQFQNGSVKRTDFLDYLKSRSRPIDFEIIKLCLHLEREVANFALSSSKACFANVPLTKITERTISMSTNSSALGLKNFNGVGDAIHELCALEDDTSQIRVLQKPRAVSYSSNFYVVLLRIYKIQQFQLFYGFCSIIWNWPQNSKVSRAVTISHWIGCHIIYDTT